MVAPFSKKYDQQLPKTTLQNNWKYQRIQVGTGYLRLLLKKKHEDIRSQSKLWLLKNRYNIFIKKFCSLYACNFFFAVNVGKIISYLFVSMLILFFMLSGQRWKGAGQSSINVLWLLFTFVIANSMVCVRNKFNSTQFPLFQKILFLSAKKFILKCLLLVLKIHAQHGFSQTMTHVLLAYICDVTHMRIRSRCASSQGGRNLRPIRIAVVWFIVELMLSSHIPNTIRDSSPTFNCNWREESSEWQELTRQPQFHLQDSVGCK